MLLTYFDLNLAILRLISGLFLGNDQEALRLLSSGNVRVDCLDEVNCLMLFLKLFFIYNVINLSTLTSTELSTVTVYLENFP